MLPLADTVLVAIEDGTSIGDKIIELQKNTNVEYAEPNHLNDLFSINTNDTAKDLLWGLHNSGQSGGLEDADIDYPEAMNIYNGQDDVIVAVIDLGVMYNHPDLQANMWDGSNCTMTSLEYDRGNTNTECIHGFNFAYHDNDPYPMYAGEIHGTHVAGTIGAVTNNNKGILGVAPNVKIMSLNASKQYCGNGHCEIKLDSMSVIESIYFAMHNGAKIINTSFGWTSYSQALYDAIKDFGDNGGIFIAAAGNNNVNMYDEYSISYPAGYDLDKIIAVAATDRMDALTEFSNYGTASVDVGAPGTAIFSTTINNVVENSDQEVFIDYFDTNLSTEYVVSPINSWSSVSDNFLYSGGSDANNDYLPNNNIITFTPQDLSDATSAVLNIPIACDTEYNITEWTDYLAIEASSDGVNFEELYRFDEVQADLLQNNDLQNDAVLEMVSASVGLPSEYLVEEFKFRFRWISNNNSIVGQGCFVDSIKLQKNTSQNTTVDAHYIYKGGTSMAAPHVAGLAAVLASHSPGMSSMEIKSTILETGDAISDLVGKTLTGKRINAFNALASLDSSRPIITLNGESEITLMAGGDYTEQGANAVDALNNDISIDIVTTGTVNTFVVGQYVVRYDVSDASDKESVPIFRIVTVTTNPALVTDCVNMVATGVSKVECETLMAIYDSTNGTNWTNKHNWNTAGTSINSWYGITVEDGRVEEIDLSNNNLIGDIPTEIGNLTDVYELNLANNQISGELPIELGNLDSLSYLYLSHNQLTGDIPIELVNLEELFDMYLNNNMFTGVLPEGLGDLNDLEQVNISSDEFSGVLPNFNSLNNDLEFLDISNNKFTFVDLESQHGLLMDALAENYNFAPQLALDTPRTIFVQDGEGLTIVPTIGVNPSGNDDYVWYKDGVMISGLEGRERICTKVVTENDGGHYTYSVSNGEISQLSLNSHNSGEFINVVVGEEVRGDVNQDGDINIIDAQLILRYALGLDMSQTIWQDFTDGGDVDCSGDIISADAMLVFRYSLDLDMIDTQWCLN